MNARRVVYDLEDVSCCICSSKLGDQVLAGHQIFTCINAHRWCGECHAGMIRAATSMYDANDPRARIKCPTCKIERTARSLGVEQLVLQEKVRCPFPGCSLAETLILKEMRSHIELCGAAPAVCPAQPMCDWTGLRSDAGKHQERCIALACQKQVAQTMDALSHQCAVLMDRVESFSDRLSSTGARIEALAQQINRRMVGADLAAGAAADRTDSCWAQVPLTYQGSILTGQLSLSGDNWYISNCRVTSGVHLEAALSIGPSNEMIIPDAPYIGLFFHAKHDNGRALIRIRAESLNITRYIQWQAGGHAIRVGLFRMLRDSDVSIWVIAD